jgi:hypothetical protein
LVETARETFRDVIAELLAPHYRRLAELSGIEPPVPEASLKQGDSASVNAKRKKTSKSNEETESVSVKVKPKRQSRTKAGNGANTSKPKTKSKTSKTVQKRMAKK